MEPWVLERNHRAQVVVSSGKLDHDQDVVVLHAPLLGRVDRARERVRDGGVARCQGAGRSPKNEAGPEEVPALQLVDPDRVLAHVTNTYLRLNSGAIKTIIQRVRSSPA